MSATSQYWKRIGGVDLFKVEYYAKYLLYKTFGLKLPKLRDQRDYWTRRGQVYMDEITASGYLEREVFFQEMLISQLRTLEFQSFFEAGCGFGWNIKRVKEEFPTARVGGVDFSLSQLKNSLAYTNGLSIPVTNGDACCLPFQDNAYDVAFSLGVFMNIHPDRIETALREMMRVSGKYIIHLEYDQDHTTPELREKRAFKTNIVSHDYVGMYKNLGGRILSFLTYEDFGDPYIDHQRAIKTGLDRWEGFEGPEKYVFLVVAVD